MKYIKKYEQLIEDPQPGDYIIFHTFVPGGISPKTGKLIEDESNYVIGRIYNVRPKYKGYLAFDVEYKLETKKKYTRRVLDFKDIIYYSKNKISEGDLEIIIAAKKYNI